ncbi:MAG: O-antigen ligase domain-containing protein [Gammaproteobacteria bacterium]|nr:O-antigen ligase domain-containing protein [Gammaproteobacteria bacterium]
MHITAERLIGLALAWTFPLYAIGALYVSGPVLAWCLFGLIAWHWRQLALHPLIWLWAAGMALMEVALIIGHINMELPLVSMIKSSIGWAKGWALMALFIAAGALLRSADVLYRGACQVGVAALCLTPILFVAGLAGLPETLFVSPLKIVGGSGPEFFEVRLYEFDPGFGMPRLRYFAPWAPAIGLVGNVLLLLTLMESDARWRIAGSVGCVAMIVLSLSRLGWIIALTVPTTLAFMRHAHRPALWLAAAPIVFAIGILMPTLLQAVETVFDSLMGARADSTLVRSWLAEIALQRWQSEAPIWGHGIVETGPHLVQFMPIGSHHSWLGLLFVKGVVGVVALALPMLFTTLFLLARSTRSALSRTAFGVMLVLSLYTFGENLEILAYLFWPGLLVVGHALSQTRTLQ